MAPRTLIVGFGKIGQQVAQSLCSSHEVWVLSRSASQRVDALGLSGNLSAIDADLTNSPDLAEQLPAKLDYVLYCVAPSVRDEASYRQVYVEGLRHVIEATLAGSMLRHLFFVSSTSVYHQDDSSWVDESSDTAPSTFSGKIIREAEQCALNQAFDASIVRFSGIYGGTRSNLIDQVKAGKSQLSPHERLSNRIHEEDCVGFLLHLFSMLDRRESLSDIYLATDSEPCDLNDVLSFIANQHQCDVAVSDQPTKRRTGNKRCSNQRMLATGYSLRYPSYREGYGLQS